MLEGEGLAFQADHCLIDTAAAVTLGSLSRMLRCQGWSISDCCPALRCRCGIAKGPVNGLTVDLRLVENEDGALRKLGEGAHGQARLCCVA